MKEVLWNLSLPDLIFLTIGLDFLQIISYTMLAFLSDPGNAYAR